MRPYFVAWNEFPANNPTSVVFMSTVPNQTVKEYEDNQWRARTIRFFQNNPDAAFYEQRFHSKKLGRWTWPHTFFAQKKQIYDDVHFYMKRVGPRYRNGGEIKRPQEPDGPTVSITIRGKTS